jgi:hypothetical protein
MGSPRGSDPRPGWATAGLELDLDWDRALVERADDGFGQAELGGEKRGEVATHDLGGRPPQRLGVDDRVRPGCLRAQEPRHEAGEEQPTQDRSEGLRPHGRARVGRDRRGGGVRLLRGGPSLLERELAEVAGGVDVGEAENPAALVRRPNSESGRSSGVTRKISTPRVP